MSNKFSDKAFNEDLEKVFEERVSDMSPQLVSMLRELWTVGRKRLLGDAEPSAELEKMLLQEFPRQEFQKSESSMKMLGDSFQAMGKAMKKTADQFQTVLRPLADKIVQETSAAAKDSEKEVVGSVKLYVQKVRDSDGYG